uniref:DUF148 domain-containing protein n=1 Tax=Steinernema glaseri TaxID=37863 RepID=A0A1I8AM82_9BILA
MRFNTVLLAAAFLLVSTGFATNTTDSLLPGTSTSAPEAVVAEAEPPVAVAENKTSEEISGTSTPAPIADVTETERPVAEEEAGSGTFAPEVLDIVVNQLVGSGEASTTEKTVEESKVPDEVRIPDQVMEKPRTVGKNVPEEEEPIFKSAIVKLPVKNEEPEVATTDASEQLLNDESAPSSISPKFTTTTTTSSANRLGLAAIFSFTLAHVFV